MLLDEPARQDNIVAMLNSSVMLQRAVAAGVGIGEIPLYRGQRENLVGI